MEVPLKAIVPEEALKLPVTVRLEEREKLLEVVTEPEMVRAFRVKVPAPEIVLEVPLKVVMHEEVVKELLTDKSPAMVVAEEVLTVPETVKLLKTISEPEMVFEVPPIVRVPLPPEI